MSGHIRQRTPGSWQITYELPKGPGGKRKQAVKTMRGTKKEAERELRRLLQQIDTGCYVEPNKLTVEEYLQRWLAEVKSSNRITQKTWERYEEIVRCHLTPALGSRLLERLQPLQIQEYYSWAQECGRRDGKGGLSAKTMLQHHRVLHKALGQAVKWRLLTHNPAGAIETPRPKPVEKAILDDEQMALMLTEARKGTHFIPFLLGVSTGMRRGEVCGLRWQDVNIDTGKLTVNQSVEQTRGGLNFKPPKTQKGRRVIDLSPSVVAELRRHKGEQAQQRLLLGSTYKDHGLVVAKPDGSPVPPDRLTKAFKLIVRKLGLAGNLHGLRHTHASQLMRQGEHIKVVSERLGHARVGFTLDCYTHLLPTQQEGAAQRLDATLQKAMGG